MTSNWITANLQNCFKLKSGENLTAKKMVPGDYNVFGGNGVAGTHHKFNLSGDNVIIGRVGALCGNARHITDDIWLTDNAFKIIDKKYDFDNKFLTYLLNFKELRSLARQAAQPVISNSSLADLTLSFPESIEEQKRIAAFLDKAFADIEKARETAEKNLKNAKELFDSSLQKLFSDDSVNWKKTDIDDLVQREIFDKPLDGNHGDIHPKKADFVESGVPFIMASDISNGKVNTKDCSFITREQADSLRKGFAKHGDILLSHKATIGRSAILETDLDYVMLTPQVTYYRVLNDEEILPHYVYWYFKSPSFLNEMNEYAGVGSTRAYIGITKQRKLKFAYPDKAEQINIINKLTLLSLEIERLKPIYEQKIKALDELKSSILQKAFTGELTKSKGVAA